jgi:hypothetical protein
VKFRDLDEALAWLEACNAGVCCVVLHKGIGFRMRFVYLGDGRFEFAMDPRSVQ